MINILNPDGTINENGGPYKGLDRLMAESNRGHGKGLGFFDGREDRDIELKHSDRSKSPIRAVFVRPMVCPHRWLRDDGKVGLAQMAMDAVTSDRVHFFRIAMPRRISIGWEKSGTGVSAGNYGGDTAYPSGTPVVPKHN